MVLAVPTFPQQSAQLEGFDLFESANVAYIRFARWLKQQQECLSKKAFKALLAEYGMIRREATKFIKLATASDRPIRATPMPKIYETSFTPLPMQTRHRRW